MGTSGHMQHPFDIPDVKTGQDLINYFERIAEHLSTNPGSVKFDGINVSFKLVDDESTPTGKDFRMDRGTSAPESVRGMTAADAYKKWPEGHGMPPAIDELLKIFNEALPQIEPELKALGMWDDPTKYFNTEYMKKGKTNVIEYDEKILALHGVNQFYEKKAQPHRIRKGIGIDRPGLERPVDPETGKPTKHGSTEISYDRGALESIIEKVKPIAEQHEVSLVGDVSTQLESDVDFSETLSTPFSIQMTSTESETYPLKDWLSQAVNPFDAKVQKRDGKTAWAISKEVYFAVLNGTPLMEWLETPEDVKTAINGALFNHATHELGMDVKRASTSSKGGLEGHEGIVIRGIDDRPVKVTGDFITKGASGAIKDKIKADKEEEIISEVIEEPIDYEFEIEDDFEESGEVTEKKIIAVYPGRFQPMGRHHAEVFKEILNDPKYDEVFIATSDTVDMSAKEGTPKSPFNFQEKKQIIQSHDISSDNIIKVKNPYNAKEILQNYNPEEYSVVYLVGEKDMKESPRFQKTEGTTDEGWEWQIGVAPHVSIDVPGHGEMSGTTLRTALKGSDPESFQQIMGFYDPLIYDLIKNKLRQLEENQLPLGIFLRMIEESLTGMYGQAGATLGYYNTGKHRFDDGEECDPEIEDCDEDLEETSSMGGGAAEMGAGKRDKAKPQGLIREVEDYLFRILGVSSMHAEEERLRKLIRKGIKVIKEKRKNIHSEESKLGEVIRQVIPEVDRKTAVADKVVHKNTGINVLDDLLKRIITQIEDAYTNLSSSEKERKSFRYHFLVNFKNALAPIDANRVAPGGDQMQLAELDFKVGVEQDDITSEPDESKFLPARSKDIEQAKEDEEEEENEFIKLDSDDPYVQQGASESEKAWNDVQQQIVSSYERLIAPEDAHIFKDWGLTNLKLYFDKFEGEMSDQIGEEPESPDYPQTEETTEETLEEVYNI